MSMPVLGYVSISSTSFPVISRLAVRKKPAFQDSVFFWFCVFSLFFEAANYYVGFNTGNNLWMFQLYLSCDFLFFSWYFHHAHHRPLWSPVISILAGLLVLTVEYLSITQPQHDNLLSWFHVLIFLYFFIQATLSLLRTFEEEKGDVFKRSVFWVAFARMFYFLTLIFVFAFPFLIQMSLENETVAIATDFINYFSNISLNVFYSVSFLCLKMKN